MTVAPDRWSSPRLRLRYRIRLTDRLATLSPVAAMVVESGQFTTTSWNARSTNAPSASLTVTNTASLLFNRSATPIIAPEGAPDPASPCVAMKAALVMLRPKSTEYWPRPIRVEVTPPLEEDKVPSDATWDWSGVETGKLSTCRIFKRQVD